MSANSAALLSAHVRAHNWSVLAASGAAFFLAVIGWSLVYAAAYWAAVLITTVQSYGGRIPGAGFQEVCLWVFLSLMGVGLLDVWINRHEEAVDHKSKLQHLYDVVMFLPRLTLAGIVNFSAWAWLPPAGKPHAARLLERLRAEKAVPLGVVPLEIPNDSLRRRVLAVLEITQLVEVRPEKGQLVLRWNALAPSAFRSLPHHAHDEGARVRRLPVLEEKDALPGAKEQPALGDGNGL